ncbi:hypothetical protein OO006_08705 [Prosthecochloris sp. SCSIO W1101]|uniref:hypothetical protein n=1 Tax=Prosthecochloris sp. SCSIO W1101 TaxID=2992242 RepID=UPI00223D7358|nr:hypothetical protein [Prosthecochloris sp. SCSIO W1101]UZJ40442.1 hypothetical protein OO006_08705 [Prosthecochloris sp. SCSIO W1101]
MTIAQSKLLFETLLSDEPFRDSILSAGSMLECKVLIEARGFDCSTSELRMTLEKYIEERNFDKEHNFSLWESIFPE